MSVTWELSYEKLEHKVIVYENRSGYFDTEVKEKFGTLQKNDAGQYYFKKSFFIEGILESQLQGLLKIIDEIKGEIK
jgi:hypothetical protein